MALTSYGVNDPLTVKLWSKVLAEEVLKATEIAPLIGNDSGSIIQRKTELSKGPGDKVTYGLRMQLTGRGVTEGQNLEGNEESLTTYSDALLINELNHAVRVKADGTIDANRVPFSMRDEAMQGLRDWMAKRLSTSFFNQVCGYTPQTDQIYTGNNATIAPNTLRMSWAGSPTSDETLGSGNLITLTDIDYAKEMAITANPQIRPVRVDGEDVYVCYLHPYQVTDLRTNTNTGQWLDISKYVYMGSRQDNPIYKGSLGQYNGVILRWSHDIPQGVNSSTGAAISTVRRAVLLGAQSAMVGFGMDRGPTSYKWVEELFDFQRELGIAIKTVWGLKKTVFNSLDFGAITISSYAVAHS